MVILSNTDSPANLPDPFDVDTTQLEYVSYGQTYSDTVYEYDSNYSTSEYKKKYTLQKFDPNIL